MASSAWRKSPPELIDAFDAVVPGPPAERRSMFGYPCCFVGGNMFMGLFQDQLHLRLGEGDRVKLIALGARVFEPMAGRPMREYVSLPPSLIADRKRLREWATRSLDYAKSIPAKQPKASKRAAKPKNAR
jgi:TfoX/Sxy family transcriptional regulator of competence genes